MKIKMQTIKNSYLLALSALTIISFVMLVTAGSVLFGRHKADITSLHRMTMNTQSEKIVKNLTSPVNVTVYQSENLGGEYPELGLQSQFLFRLLEKYQTLADGKITINVKNPEPFSIAEEEAQAAGIRAFPDNTGAENLYFGAVFTSEKGKSYTIPYFSVQRQNYTEYDISRILGKLGKFQKKTIGVADFGTDISKGQFIKQLENDYNVEIINPQNISIPKRISVLLVNNPQQVPNSFIYALDQYIMRGGKLVLLIDPYSEQAVAKHPASALYKNKLLPLLSKLGLQFNPDEIIGDKSLSTKERQGIRRDNNFVLWFDVPQDKNSGNIFTDGFLNFSFRSPGAVSASNKENANYTPLFATTADGGTVAADFAKFADKGSVNNSFKSDGNKHVLGYFATGWFESLFEQSIIAGTEQEYKHQPFLIGSIEPASILVIADSDFLADDTWNLAKYKENSTVYDQIPGANNADFLLRAIDIMSGNGDIAGLYPNYLINMDKSIGEQIYNLVFQNYAAAYQKKENEITELLNGLETFKASLRSNEVGLSISKIQEIENHHRQLLKLQEELKLIEYRIKTANERKAAEIIVVNALLAPMLLILLLWIGIKIFKRRQKQKILRLINE